MRTHTTLGGFPGRNSWVRNAGFIHVTPPAAQSCPHKSLPRATSRLRWSRQDLPGQSGNESGPRLHRLLGAESKIRSGQRGGTKWSDPVERRSGRKTLWGGALWRAVQGCSEISGVGSGKGEKGHGGQTTPAGPQTALPRVTVDFTRQVCMCSKRVLRLVCATHGHCGCGLYAPTTPGQSSAGRTNSHLNQGCGQVCHPCPLRGPSCPPDRQESGSVRVRD